MTKFNVYIRQEVFYSMPIEAENEDQANQLAKEAMNNGNFGKPNGYESIEIFDITEIV